MEAFLKAVASISSLSLEAKAACEGILKRLEFPKGHLLLKEHTVCRS